MEEWRMDQLRSLRVFTQVVACGSFAGAARALDLTPAVVTRAIAELEDHLGVRLLNRTTRSLALTEIGEDYHQRAQQILQDLEAADAAAASLHGTPSGTVRILCPPAFATHQLMARLATFRERYPHIQLALSAPGPVSAADENFDVSILSIGQQALQGDFVVRQLASSAFVLCAAPAYLARHGAPQEPEDLLHHDGLLPDVSAVRRELSLFRDVPGSPQRPRKVLDSGRSRPPVLSTPHLEVLHAAAVAGMGVAGLPSFMVADALRDGRLRRVLPQWRGISLKLFAAMPSRKHVPHRTRVLLDYLVESFGGGDQDPWIAGLDATPEAFVGDGG